MTTLTIAFSPEGPTDVRFLSQIIQRTAIHLLAPDKVQQEVDVLLPIPLPRAKSSGDAKILTLGRQAYGFHCLVIHADADDATASRALAERYEPGLMLLQAEADLLCPQLVPLIPIHMTEAWMLADPEALLRILGTPLTASQLSLLNATGAERKADPKAFLEEVLNAAQTHLKRKNYRLELADLYALLSDSIALERLALLASYQQFQHDLAAALVALRLLRAWN